MEEQFVTYPILLKLQEIGFNKSFEPLGMIKGGSVFYFDEDGKLYYDYRPMYSSSASKHQILAPLWQQVLDWFEQEHKLWINIDTSVITFRTAPNGDILAPKFQIRIEDLEDRECDYLYHSADENCFFETSYEAREKAILKAIEICKNR